MCHHSKVCFWKLSLHSYHQPKFQDRHQSSTWNCRTLCQGIPHRLQKWWNTSSRRQARLYFWDFYQALMRPWSCAQFSSGLSQTSTWYYCTQKRSVHDQDLALRSSSPNRKCIVSTNIAETSLTIDDVVLIHNPRFRMDMLELWLIFKALAEQHTG